MAPVKRDTPAKIKRVASAKVSKDDPAFLEGPVSLLWAYQLRREHALLLTRMDGLAQAVQNATSSALMKDMHVELVRTGERAAAVEKRIETHSFDIQAVRGRISGGDEILAEVQAQLLASGKEWKEHANTLTKSHQHISERLEHTKIDLQEALMTQASEQQQQIQALLAKTEQLETYIEEIPDKQITVVQDSVEEVHKPTINAPAASVLAFNFSQALPKPNKQLPQSVSRAEDLFQDFDNHEEQMLTLQPWGRAKDAPSIDIDLDENIASLGYARHLHRAISPEESMMRMLPEFPEPQKPDGDNFAVATMKQSASETWEEYLLHGQKLLEVSPKRKEGAVVDAFVEGILDNGLRASCEHWLDARVWIWERLQEFAVSWRRRNQARQPSSTPSVFSTPQKPHKPQAIERKTSKQRDLKIAVSKGLKRILVDQNQLPQHQRIEPVDTQARSGRISQRNVASASQATTQQLLLQEKTMPPLEKKLVREIQSKTEKSTLEKPGKGAKRKRSIHATVPLKRHEPEILEPQTSAPEESAKERNCKGGVQVEMSQKENRLEVHANQTPVRRIRPVGRQKRISSNETYSPVNFISYQQKAMHHEPSPASLKRKLEQSKQKALSKRSKGEKRKRGPPPPIPILPSSDSIDDLQEW